MQLSAKKLWVRGLAIAAMACGLANVTPAVAGSNALHTCAITASGGVKCWGYNEDRQLGDGTAFNSATPVDVLGLTSPVAQISTGTFATCAVTTSGGAKCWGYGNAGDGNGPSSATPIDVPGLESGVSAVSANYYYACALTTGGGVKCWGYNSNGQLGDSTAPGGPSLVNVAGLSSGVVQITTGGTHACALTTGGGVKCWGAGSGGQLGNGNFTDSATPVDVLGLSSGVAQVSAGLAHTCALMTSGGVKCWGFGDNYGNLGNGTFSSSATPVDVVGLASGVAELSAGAQFTCVRKTAGGVACWGDNQYQELGDGNVYFSSPTPVAVSGLSSGVTQINAGGYHACALMTSGGVKCWGYNGQGQVGDGTFVTAVAPVGVSGLASGVVRLPEHLTATTGVTATVPKSCADIRAVNRVAPDGVYVIVPNAKLFEVYCHDMAGTPAEYLRLVNTGGLYNFSTWAAEYHTPTKTLTTHYTMVRLDPVTLLVDIGDQTFATSSAGPVGGPGIPVSSMPYATAADCRSSSRNYGKANVDLNGNPFVVDDTFVVSGWYSSGSANSLNFRNSGGNSRSIPVQAQVVNLTGGGFCGGVGPSAGWAINDGGGFDLQLKYTGPEATGPDACKKNGWKAFGDIFKNQGDCVSFFATGGRNPPAGGN